MTHFPINSKNVEPQRSVPAEVNARKEACLLLDVRTPVEFEGVKISGAVLRPVGSVDAGEVERLADGREVVIICQSGGRAGKVAAELKGRVNVPLTILEGGVNAWEAEGLPVERGQSKVISLERQVRIAAGLFVLTGVVLGTWVHPGFYGLAGFVGAGLVFAGITDTCGMGLLLAKMPWNQQAKNCCSVKR